VNHFAHAVVAAAHGPDPALALGAMLPDFAGMLGTRVGALSHPALRAGCALHHASDAAFHGAPEFVALLSAGSARLRGDGLARGPARAAAHVGLELLFDAALAHDAVCAAHYARALAESAKPEVDAAIAWRSADAAPRWLALRVRLCARGAPRADEDCDALAQRVARALASRPRLALSPDSHECVARWLADARPGLRAASPDLVSAVVQATRRPW
jgi:hypothetical protein